MAKQSETKDDNMEWDSERIHSENCLICVQNLDDYSLSSCQSLGYDVSSRIFIACCRMLKINEKEKILSWNFHNEILPLCIVCLTRLKGLPDLFDEWERIKKSISEIKDITQNKILSSHSKVQKKNFSRTRGKNRRKEYFRSEAVKEFLPELPLKNVMKSLDLPGSNTPTLFKKLEIKTEPTEGIYSENEEEGPGSNSDFNQGEFNDFSSGGSDESDADQASDEEKIKKKVSIVVKPGKDVTVANDGKWIFRNVEFTEHKSSGRLKCSQCRKLFSSEYSIRRHIKNIHMSNRRKPSNQQLVRQIGHGRWSYRDVEFTKANKSNAFVCTLCSKSYLSKGTMRRHIRLRHYTPPPSSITETQSAKRGETSQTKEKPEVTIQTGRFVKLVDTGKWTFKSVEFSLDESTGRLACSLCDKLCGSANTIKKHIRRTHPNSEFEKTPSEFVKEVGPGKWTYRNVEFTKAENSETYSCSHCNQTYMSISSIRRHIRLRLASSDKSGCPVMSRAARKNFPRIELGGDKFSYGGIEYTLTEEEGVKKFHCFACGHQSTEESIAKCHFHIRRLHGEKLHECQTCGNKYAFKSALRKHEVSHKTERTFQCSQCGVVTKSFDILRAHEKNVHEKIRNCVCPYCGKAFYRQTECNAHIRTHTKEKPFKCDHPGCSSSFSIKTSLRKHKLSHELDGYVKVLEIEFGN